MMWRTVVASAVLMTVAGCGGASKVDTSMPGLSDGPTTASAPKTHAVGKYEQTWPHSYAKTTCGQFLAKMNAHQRFVAAADMLSGARDNGDGGHGVAPDKLIRKFIADVDDACGVTTSSKLADIAAGIYLTERAKYEP